MNFLFDHLLSIILFFPAVAAVLVIFLPNGEDKLARWVAFIASLVPFALTLVLWSNFDATTAGTFQFEESYVWYAIINSNFHIGVDGISLSMVLLTTLLTPLAILASFNITEKVKAYMMLFLFLEMGMLGVFMSMDLLIFFVFWEIGLVPMYFLINQWGSANRNYASLKFMIYTIGGSLGLLLAIQLLGVLFGTYDIAEITAGWTALTSGTVMGLSVATVKTVAFWAFVIAFAIKVPVWPFHTWLPDAHTEAPVAGSMILAGVLLKLGAYGFIRLVLPLYPAESARFAGWLAFLAVMAIVFGAFGAYGQWDFKRLVAYSSVNHMGFVLLGIAAAAKAHGTASAHIAMNGAILQMFNHGISAAAMFFLVGVIYDRTHTRDLKRYGGLFPLIPVFGGILIFASMSSLGLPGLNGFVSEFLVVRGAWAVMAGFTAVAMLGLLFTGSYILKGIKNVLHGPLNEEWAHGDHKISDINFREVVVILPLMALMLSLGLAPAWLLSVINNAVTALF